jgi:iron complex outermembrane recepter protein
MKKYLLLTTALSAGLAGAALTAAPALAQASPDDASQLETVVVTGFRGSLRQSLDLKRDAVGVRDSIVAEDIGKYPALNIAESLTRVPGVVLSRDGGSNEGKQVTVRGLNSTYTVVTVNGLPLHVETGTSIGQNSRAVDLDTFGPDIFSRVDFYKTPQADLEEGGIGGVVDMRTAHPFDYSEDQFRYSLGESYNDYRERGLPRATLFASKTWNKFGALIAVSASKVAYENMGTQVTGPAQGRNEICGNSQNVNYDFGPGKSGGCGASTYAGVDPRANIGSLTVDQVQQAFVSRFIRAYVSTDDRTRYSGVMSLQYKPSDKLDFALDLMAARLIDTHIENTFGMYFRSTGPTTAAGYAAAQANPALIGQGADSGIVPVNIGIDPNNNNLYGTFANTDRYNESRFYDGKTNYISGSLSGKYQASENLSFNGIASMGDANGFYSDNRIILNLYNLVTTFDNRNNKKIPQLSTPTDVTNVGLYSNPGQNIGYKKESDRSLNFKLDADYTGNTGLGAIDHFTAKLGVGYESARKTNDQKTGDSAFGSTVFSNGLKFSQMPISSYAVNHLSESNLFDGLANGGMPTQWASVPRSFMYSLDPNKISASTPSVLGGVFDVTEVVKSIFLQLNTDGNVFGRPLRLGGGLRFSKTNLGGHNYNAGLYNPLHGSYDDLLPSFNAAFDLTDDLILRASYGKTITRPALASIAGGTTIPNRFNLIANTGNPGLKPLRSNNFDVGAEWYFADQAVLSTGLFYKQLNGLISNQQTTATFGSLNIPSALLDPALYGNPVPAGTLLTVNHPVNLNPLAVKGVEVYYQQPFLFLPEPLDGLGLIAGFTYAVGNAGGAGTGFTSNAGLVSKQPINGLSKYSYSLTGYYEKGAYSFRASYNWNSKQTTNGVTNQNGTNLQQWQQARGQLDGSIAYKLTDDIELRLDGANLLNEVSYQFFADGTGKNSQVGARFAPAGWGSDGFENVLWQGRTFIFTIRGQM